MNAYPATRPATSPRSRALGSGGGAAPGAAYIAAVKAAGGTPAAGWAVAEPAIAAFFAAGWVGMMDTLYLHCFGNAAANLIDMGSAASRGSFEGTVTHQANTWTGNGSDGYLDTGRDAVNDVGMSVSSLYAFALTLGENTAENDMLFGNQNVAGDRFYCYTRPADNEIRGQVDTNVATLDTAGTTAGIVSMNMDASNLVTALRKSTGRLTFSDPNTAGRGPAAKTIFIGARNGTTTGGNNHSDCPFGASGFGQFISGGDADFTTALRTLWETCTGASII